MSEYQTLRDHDGGDDDDVRAPEGADWKSNMATLGKRLGESMTVVGGKLSEQVSTVGERMKDLFHAPTLGERLVDEATADVLIGPDWEKNLQICDLVNSGKVPGGDVVRGIKRRLAVKGGHVQLLALWLLETALKNSERLFSDVAAEKVLDAMVRLVDDPASPAAVREKCLKLIEAWGEATEELRYLPVFEETYKSLKSRGIEFPPRDPESLAPIFTPAQTQPTRAAAAAVSAAAAAGAPVDVAVPTGTFLFGGAAAGAPQPGVRTVDTPEGRVVVLDSKEILSVARNSVELLSTVLSSAPPEEVVKDELAASLASQCRAAKQSVQRLVENESDNETLLFEALTVNDDLDKVLDKFAQLQTEHRPASEPVQGNGAPAAAATPMADLLAPPQPLPAHSGAVFAGPSGEGEADAGEELVRRRAGGANPAAPAASDDERALAELDAMVFGSGAPGPAPAASARGSEQQEAAGQAGDAKKKEEDLIVF